MVLLCMDLILKGEMSVKSLVNLFISIITVCGITNVIFWVYSLIYPNPAIRL